MSELPSLPELDVLERTRHAWHSLAEHVLSAARHRATGRIGLVVVPGGFATPPCTHHGQHEEVQVVRRDVIVRHGDSIRTEPISTLREAATLIGIEPGAPTSVFRPTTALEPDEELDIEDDAAAALGSWFELGWSVLLELQQQANDVDAPSAVQLWPEHFDAAVEVGDNAAGQRGTFGVSPGDGAHPAPYLYVTHWREASDHPYWNDRAFSGASRSYDELRNARDPRAAAHEFFTEGRARLRSL